MKTSEAIASLKTLCNTCTMFPKCVNNKPECFQAIEMAISALEKQEADRWHSIAKEGKPKESGTYIWTCDDGTHRKLVTVAKYFKRTGECILTGARSYWKAKAWKPLPEAYEEEDE